MRSYLFQLQQHDSFSWLPVPCLNDNDAKTVALRFAKNCTVKVFESERLVAEFDLHCPSGDFD